MERPRIAILDGLRTPFGRAGGTFAEIHADDLATAVVRELLARSGVPGERVDELIIGNVAQPTHAANIARVISRKAGLPDEIVAYTIHHNCASGLQALTTAALRIQTGQASLVIAGGTESMSHIPLIVGHQMTALFMRLARARTLRQRVAALAGFRPSYLKPVIALELGLTDPVCGLNMGQTAELLAGDFSITREQQDALSLESHRKAQAAIDGGRFADEVLPIIGPPSYDARTVDEGPRPEQSMEALARLRPYFDRYAGTVTAGNSCQITDGAAAVILATQETARELGVTPLGYLTEWAYAGLEGERMGLGPFYSTAKLLEKTGLALDDFDVIELNEAFAAQVIANEHAFASDDYCREHLGREAIGKIDRERLNPNGGAIALGHPVGATGTRLALTVLHELRRRSKTRGLATLCVGGGQGAAVMLEAA